MIATADIIADARVKRLLGHVAVLLRDGFLNADARLEDDLADDLLALAPEYVPPFTDRDHDPDDWQAWDALIEEAPNVHG